MSHFRGISPKQVATKQVATKPSCIDCYRSFSKNGNPLKSGLSFSPSYFFQTYPQRRYKRKKLLLELSLTSIYFTMFHKKNPGVVPALEVNNFANYFFLSVELLKQLSWWRHTLFDSNYLACNVMPEGISVFVSCLGLLD